MTKHSVKAFLHRELHGAVLAMLVSCACPGAVAHSPDESYGQFQEMISRLRQLPQQEHQAVLDAAFAALRQKAEFPLVSGTQAVFVYQGLVGKVEIAGDMTGWISSFPLQRIEGTNLFYSEQTYEPEARLDYKLIVDGAWQLDPLNRKECRGGFGPNSELRMPGYLEHPETEPHEDVPRGVVETSRLESRLLGQSRPLSVYLPVGYDRRRKYPVIFFQDGRDYLRLGRANHTLDYLIHHHRLAPVVAVFVEPLDRSTEYALNDQYVSFFVQELLPWVTAHYSVSDRAADRVLVGDSLGGLISFYIAQQHPEKFGQVLSHSGAFFFPEDSSQGHSRLPFLNSALLAEGSLPLRLFLVVGSYEKKVSGGYDLLEGNQNLHAYVKANPTVREVALRVYPQGHSWCLWTDTLAEGLVWLLGIP